MQPDDLTNGVAAVSATVPATAPATTATTVTTSATGNDSLEARIKALNDENAARRIEARDAKQALTQAQAQYAELQTKLTAQERASAARLALIASAARAGFNDPEDVLRLVDVAGIEASEDAKRPEAITTAITSLVASKPYLVKAASPATPPAAGAGTSIANPATKATLSVEDVKKMTPAQINENWSEVSKVLGG